MPNGLVDTTSLSITYVIAGSPASLTITVTGVKNAAGECQLLDSYSGTTSTSRTINLTDTYDSFKLTAVWTGGSNVSVGAALSSTGAGPHIQLDKLASGPISFSTD